jgi:hypothetical protein
MLTLAALPLLIMFCGSVRCICLFTDIIHVPLIVFQTKNSQSTRSNSLQRRTYVNLVSKWVLESC